MQKLDKNCKFQIVKYTLKIFTQIWLYTKIWIQVLKFAWIHTNNFSWIHKDCRHLQILKNLVSKPCCERFGAPVQLQLTFCIRILMHMDWLQFQLNMQRMHFRMENFQFLIAILIAIAIIQFWIRIQFFNCNSSIGFSNRFDDLVWNWVPQRHMNSKWFQMSEFSFGWKVIEFFSHFNHNFEFINNPPLIFEFNNNPPLIFFYIWRGVIILISIVTGILDA